MPFGICRKEFRRKRNRPIERHAQNLFYFESLGIVSDNPCADGTMSIIPPAFWSLSSKEEVQAVLDGTSSAPKGSTENPIVPYPIDELEIVELVVETVKFKKVAMPTFELQSNVSVSMEAIKNRDLNDPVIRGAAEGGVYLGELFVLSALANCGRCNGKDNAT